MARENNNHQASTARPTTGNAAAGQETVGERNANDRSNVITLGDLAGQGLDELDLPDDSTILPTLRLQQPKARNVTRPGTFQNTRTLESYSTLENVVFLRMRQQRLFYSNDAVFDGESSLACWSDDGKVPASDVKVKLNATCSSCPKATTTGGDPWCKKSIATIVAIGASRGVFQLDFAGASERTAANIYQYVRSNDLPLYGAVVDLTADERHAKNGNRYFVITFSNVLVLPDDELAQVTSLYQQYKDYPLKARRQHAG